MAKTYKTYLPDQDLLLPPSLRDWLPENHLAYCVSDVVDQLDLSAIESVYEEEDRGQEDPGLVGQAILTLCRHECRHGTRGRVRHITGGLNYPA